MNALANTGELSIETIRAYWTLMAGSLAWGNANSFSNYAGTTGYNANGAFTFPSTDLSISNFYGASPVNEWATGTGGVGGVADGEGAGGDEGGADGADGGDAG